MAGHIEEESKPHSQQYIWDDAHIVHFLKTHKCIDSKIPFFSIHVWYTLHFFYSQSHLTFGSRWVRKRPSLIPQMNEAIEMFSESLPPQGDGKLLCHYLRILLTSNDHVVICFTKKHNLVMDTRPIFW